MRACSVREGSVFESFRVYVWTGKYDSKTLRVNADFFEYGGKKPPYRKYPGTYAKDLSLSY